ncbi:uncharacterized protein EV420DRAFT_1473447 [Desarmillaria tabescens]|uniref:Uncharacterized protein n=1 Tax=Armillaria tabescens TaxID=1929756 RepID=A0AA39NRX5_ARMTA|nr:uncharacterized protein EV420DRAFT_1473447 [Desarmillaria tabescens]KAK0470393.1 hypothetical protein EV420DRAFT_1473447 [Desarmillaria tabescens]
MNKGRRASRCEAQSGDRTITVPSACVETCVFGSILQESRCPRNAITAREEEKLKVVMVKLFNRTKIKFDDTKIVRSPDLGADRRPVPAGDSPLRLLDEGLSRSGKFEVFLLAISSLATARHYWDGRWSRFSSRLETKKIEFFNNSMPIFLLSSRTVKMRQTSGIADTISIVLDPQQPIHNESPTAQGRPPFCGHFMPPAGCGRIVVKLLVTKGKQYFSVVRFQKRGWMRVMGLRAYGSFSSSPKPKIHGPSLMMRPGGFRMRIGLDGFGVRQPGGDYRPTDFMRWGPFALVARGPQNIMHRSSPFDVSFRTLGFLPDDWDQRTPYRAIEGCRATLGATSFLPACCYHGTTRKGCRSFSTAHGSTCELDESSVLTNERRGEAEREERRHPGEGGIDDAGLQGANWRRRANDLSSPTSNNCLPAARAENFLGGVRTRRACLSERQFIPLAQDAMTTYDYPVHLPSVHEPPCRRFSLSVQHRFAPRPMRGKIQHSRRANVFLKINPVTANQEDYRPANFLLVFTTRLYKVQYVVEETSSS